MRPRSVSRLLGTMAPGLMLMTLVATGCGAPVQDRRVSVLAAASLVEPFTELAQRFEAEHPGVDVVVSFGSSTTLAQQAADGAPGDVLATADERSMSLAVEAGAAGDPVVFASNRLVLVVPPDNPASVAGVLDLDRADVSYVTCVPTAPCGRVAGALLADAGTERPAVSEEVDVKAVLGRVVAGEADAGLVYRSDAVAAGDAVRALPTPGARAHPTDYFLARLGTGDEPTGQRGDELAEALVDLVLSATGRRVLADAGLDPAPAPGSAP